MVSILENGGLTPTTFSISLEILYPDILFTYCSQDTNFEVTADETDKVLGLVWNSDFDTFKFKVALNLSSPFTKRQILSEFTRIFDPLGLLFPCTVWIKIFYHKLCLVKGDWDSHIPSHLVRDWIKFQEAFNRINSCEIPRCVTLLSDGVIQSHGFADDSSLAYATAIYCHQAHGVAITVNLLVSKTKGAAIKQVSVPPLELWAAHLLSDLFLAFIKTLVRYDFEVFAWTDSKVALSWLSTHPRKCETFVANRTSQILEV
ncbi:hypothetical protein AVEN_263512-1 [Araneus ventricosus]|uniref:Reverse transcriptase domain-containing protein n=1 Tax=Araneus ventricosus TaxID=182803 RepID=A0A4Y2EYS0_ARAVE|nr:hypothetical protein AVEN_263512-1 [Araneus ventricosus]